MRAKKISHKRYLIDESETMFGIVWNANRLELSLDIYTGKYVHVWEWKK